MNKIRKARTFGIKGDWQVERATLKAFMSILERDLADQGHNIYEELLDDIIVAFVGMGYMEWDD